MRLGYTLASLSWLALPFAKAANSTSLPTINITGNAFFNSETGERFYIRGVDYQPGGSSNLSDPLADATTCKRDVAVFKDLGVNTIRVYTVDNSQDHSDCMQMLTDANIYVILDVNTPDSSISRYDPACSYNADYLQNVFATVDAFASYDNVLGFFAGNEVINSVNTTNTATYVKAVVRDMKKYIKARGYRQIPVGYSAADVSSNRQLAAEYFNCGSDDDARIDMFGVNDYSWCGQSSFQTSGYATKMKLYANYSIPIFLSEFGCNEVPGSRPFTEITAIYSDRMSSVFSGGLVYEYSNETNNYGLVQIDNDTSVTKLQDYYNLQKEYSSVSDPSGDGGYSTTNDYSSCPSYEEGTWEANNTLPAMPSAASAYFSSGAGEPMGTSLSTQELCYGDDTNSDNVSSSSESKSSSASSSSSSSAASSSTLSASSSSSTTASSTSASSSKAKDGAHAVRVPLVFQAIVHIWNYVL
ncbi:LAFE_0G10660g1_1 [Lachancea fermentati]|uniref:1,3-beta-glucanosyltransferase n=1 Tax=Lachancea fermentati TaxID=4955 RepID=A0A1G4MHS2_LACFM|nr:LAFE_0G10660g1_1 [Lachancea fermentati]